MNNPIQTTDFSAIKLKLASPDEILAWSHGEIKRPETINYRTQKPEKDGLFCEKIFGPSKDWECYCGKYKKIRYKGIICDKCGVEVTHSIVRRERMGHISLETPATHIWFLRGLSSKVGIILNLSMHALEKVVYFASFIITDLNEDLKAATIEQIKNEYKTKTKSLELELNRQVSEIKNKKGKLMQDGVKANEAEKILEKEIKSLTQNYEEKKENLDQAFEQAQNELKELKPMAIISENEYQNLSLKYGHIFEAGIGAEAVRKLLGRVDLGKTINELEAEFKGAIDSKKEKLTKRLKLFKGLRANNIKPEWMVLTIVPVIPPDLRPMVALDGGRFATSDLNDLYRRVINRNNRLRQLVELSAPEVICRNEKRMLQEAVDALIDNSARHSKTVAASTGQKRQLKSLADSLKGKQGRFRQNLLGKRIDYSGRSVIVVNPKLKLNQCGLPKTMALELFKPFIISKLINQEIVHNVRSASRFIETGETRVWDILEDIVKGAYVLLNRAPTLHRLGIQAFQPILIEGKAIQIHPLVCSAFNADFDGDQMAVHVPLTREAKEEAKNIILSTHNLLKPATGDPVVSPGQDIVWGSYYLTDVDQKQEDGKRRLKTFSSPAEAVLAYDLRKIKLREIIKVRLDKGGITETTVGRAIFNSVLPEKLQFVNETVDKSKLKNLVKDCLRLYGEERTVVFVDELKNQSFKFITKSGLSWGMSDLPSFSEREELINEANRQVEKIQEQYEEGLLTDSERYAKVIELWTLVKEKVTSICKLNLPAEGPIHSMIDSGARGSWTQLTQIIGMKGLVTSPSGEIIELPVRGNFKRGFDVLEYFISTHATRKGLSDTALRTANAGYLTRRLVDVAQDVIVQAEDCGDKEGFLITKKESDAMSHEASRRIVGRFLAADLKNKKGKLLAKENELVTEELAEKLKKEFEQGGLEEVKIRSVLSCKLHRGVCAKCYGYDLGFNKPVKMGTAIGIIAAQSIGEPGTQLTMRTFHTGGVAGSEDITQGLPRVDEIFEARPPKKKAFIAEVSGEVKIEEAKRIIEDKSGKMTVAGSQVKILKIYYEGAEAEKYYFNELAKELSSQKEKKAKPEVLVKTGDTVKKGEKLFSISGKFQEAKKTGKVEVGDKYIKITAQAKKVKEYIVPKGFAVWVKDGDKVNKGDQLTEGSIVLQQLYELRGKLETQKYILKEIQYVYSSQGQPLNDKHIEIIARQMFSRIYIKESGDSDLLSGEIIEKAVYEINNKEAKISGKKPAVGNELLLGISKASLTTDSFLSASSFQETARVLIDAAINGKIDYLRGLKENVIIGRLIPAGTGYEGRRRD